MAFAFRAATLYLRPAEAPTSAHRLSIAAILLLTTTVAIALSFNELVLRFAIEQKVEIVQLPSSQRFIESVMFIFSALSTTLLWLSIAWLFVSRNPMRWIGVSGLFVHFALSGLMYLLVAPMYLDQVQLNLGTKPQLTFWYFVGSFAVSILHDLIVLLCFGIIHVAGYRWDIRRTKLAAEDELDTECIVPPVLATCLLLPQACLLCCAIWDVHQRNLRKRTPFVRMELAKPRSALMLGREQRILVSGTRYFNRFFSNS